MYGKEIRKQFAITYAHTGNANKALKQVLGDERAERMQPHSLRARASELLNHCEVVELIEQEKAEILKRGEILPRFHGRTWRSDLYSEDVEEVKPKPITPRLTLADIKGGKKLLRALNKVVARGK
ncbi:hypothetical protein [Avibacterium sp. 21-599]|uniref:hypothetical protein n=1 Tax=Avibacterium sp. 21-599 TaxID=2911528 RepID=UPI002245FE81|nr:hypothetical protein [Avibacterium sp. 21-599]MCW9718948.1 hypothetical protein [Avibacterium sp. 21-599]